MVDISNPSETRPIASKDRAETFAETNVTLNHSKTRVINESVGLGADVMNKTTRPDDDHTAQYDKVGNEITANRDLSGVFAKISSFTSGSKLVLSDSSGNELASKTVNAQPGDTVFIEYSLMSGTSYQLEIHDNSSQKGYYNGATIPYTGTDIDIGAATDQINPYNRVFCFKYIGGLYKNKSGSVAIEWPEPTDIYRWDAATFQATPDGETVKVYIEESSDGGSTWTEIQGPISRGDQIEADPGSLVRFRVDLARSDTSNNPTLDAIYRRWVV